MKAIQVKYLAPTNTKDGRLKAWICNSNYLIEPLCCNLEIEEQAVILVNRFLIELNWVTSKVSGFGTLPNGDFVATLEQI